MRKRALLYTLEFNGDVVHDVSHDLIVELQKRIIK